MRNKNLMCMCEGAVMVALSLALSFFRFKIWPNGGSVDLVMIPLMVFAFRRGGLWGIGAGIVLGLLKCIVTGGIAYGWQALILDYGVAYGAVGIAGFFKSHAVTGAIVASLARYFVHIISGVTIWGDWMPDEFWGLAMNNIWVYSALYNLSFMLPCAVLAALAVAVLSKGTNLLAPRRVKAA